MHMFWYSDHKDKRKDLIVAFRPCKVAQSKDTDRKNRMRARKSNLQSWGSYLASIKEWKKSKKTYRTERWYYITMACQSLQMNGRWKTGCIFVLICGRNSGRKQRHEMRSHTDHLTFFYAASMISINYDWTLDSISSISYKLFNQEILELQLHFKNQWLMQKHCCSLFGGNWKMSWCWKFQFRNCESFWGTALAKLERTIVTMMLIMLAQICKSKVFIWKW